MAVLPGRREEEPATAMLTFLDASKYQGSIDWMKVANHQIEGQYIRGVIIRATVADQSIDPMLRVNLEGARGTGRLWTGAYHNLINASVSEQFARFRVTVPDWRGVIPMVDSEQGASFRQLENFMALAHSEWGKYPLVYLPRWYWNGLVDRKPLPPEWAWVHSRYAVDPGPLIPPHTSLEGHAWQYSNKGVVSGISASVDLNRYYGEEETLLRLAVQ
jgi:GH25 family lysozyme M1 (1,4-beta-N-acetylmuramidase)